MSACSVPGCTGVYECRGFCVTHYRRFLKHGDPTVVVASTRHHFEACWAEGPPEECWIWSGPVDRGLARFRSESAARVVYAHLRGEIPRGRILEHTCGQRLCVNPDHMLVATRAEFMSRRRPSRW